MQNRTSLTIRGDQNCKVKSLLANITYVADEHILATGRSQDGAELCQLFVASSGSRNQAFDLQYNALLLPAFFKSCLGVPPHGDEAPLWAMRGWWAHTPPGDIQLRYAGPLSLSQQLYAPWDHVSVWGRRLPLQCLERIRPTPGRDRKRLKNLTTVLGDTYCDTHMVPVLSVRDRPVGRARLPEDDRASLYLHASFLS